MSMMVFNHDDLLVEPPTTANLIKNFDPQIIQSDAERTRIIVHHRFPRLVDQFLEHKRAHGSTYEKALYTQIFTWKDEVSRLVTNRPLTFMGSQDLTMLRDGTTIDDAADEWDRNGTAAQRENKYLTLSEYLSYDEIMLSSLIGVSGPSYFINDGNRHNQGIPGKPGTFQPRGVIIGLVGARFERPGRMESILVLPSARSSHQDPRLTSIFESFFGVASDDAKPFHREMYKARMQITAETFLLEANARAQSARKTAYAYVVGLGLGVWRYDSAQSGLYIDAFTAALSALCLPHISTLNFAYIAVPQSCVAQVTAAAAGQDIKVVFSNRNPAEKLDGDELLVLSYAWDGTAFPGNEYGLGSLAASGDPAAACMSTVPELHNSMVNGFAGRIEVLGGEGRASESV
jgi:hypothetical protein